MQRAGGNDLPVVLVHLGTRPPGYLATAVRHATEVVGTQPLVIDPRLAARYRGEKLDRFRATERLSPLGAKGLWRYACERFFVLEEHLRRTGIERCVHIESDVLIYLPPSTYAGWLERSYGAAVAVCPLTDSDDTAAVMYVGSLEALSILNDAMLDLVSLGPQRLLEQYGGDMAHEMRMLALLRERGLAEALPTTVADAEALEAPCLFDPASYGQWVGGTHSEPGVPFAGAHHRIGRDLLAHRYAVVWDAPQRQPLVGGVGAASERLLPLANLHIHSKRLSSWAWVDAHHVRRRIRPRAGTWVERREIVTGERLQALAEVSLVPHGMRIRARDGVVFERYGPIDERDLEQLSSRRVLFAYTHELGGFREHVWPHLEGDGYVLITHNSDDEIDESQIAWVDEAGAKLERWFAQNVAVAHPKVVPLPIGIANHEWAHGNLRALEAAARRARTPRSGLLMVAFDAGSHPQRHAIWETLHSAFPALPQAPFERRGFTPYLRDLARHRFCACPRGNGIDTHRFWECLYLGVVPIAERSYLVEHWHRCGLPVLLIDDWSEVTPDRLESEARRLPNGPRIHAPLLLSHYARLIRDAVRDGASEHSPPSHAI